MGGQREIGQAHGIAPDHCVAVDEYQVPAPGKAETECGQLLVEGTAFT